MSKSSEEIRDNFSYRRRSNSAVNDSQNEDTVKESNTNKENKKKQIIPEYSKFKIAFDSLLVIKFLK